MGKREQGTGEDERETDNGEQGTGNVSKDFEQNFLALRGKKSTAKPTHWQLGAQAAKPNG